MDDNAYKRALKIITLFFEADDLPQETRDKFALWLTDENNAEEKDAALWRVFCQSMDGDDPGEVLAPESYKELA